MPNFMELKSSVPSELLSWMTAIRRTIHNTPELAFQETATASFIGSKLTEIGIDSWQRVAGTGIVVDLGNPSASLIVGLRADMDALPIQEETDLPFASANPGVMHSCGHDGHVAILLGAAALLQKMEIRGGVRLLFQPAEEKGNGAVKMIKAGAIKGLAAIFGGHIDTHFETGVVTVDDGIVCAYADPFIITLKGSSGHAARPHECKDVIVATASLVMSLQSLVSREVDPNHAAVVTVGKIRAGETHNVIAGEAVIEGTIRSTHPGARARILSGLKRMVRANADQYDIRADSFFPEALPAVFNSSAASETARKAATKVVSSQNVVSQGPSSLGGEDFAFYLQDIQGCMVRFGARITEQTGPAHSPTFDFDESVLGVGASWYAEVARLFLEEKSNTM